MKAQAWVTGITSLSPATGSVDYTGSACHLQSQLITSLHPDAALLAKPASYPVDHPVMSSSMQPSVAKLKTPAVTAASSLPPTSSPDNTVIKRVIVSAVLNPPHSSTVVLVTPMKRVDSISASASHLRMAAIDAPSSNSRMLHYASSSGDVMGCIGYVPNDRHTKRFDGSFPLFPHVQSIVEHRSNEASELRETSYTGFKNVQQQTAGVVGERHSTALENLAMDSESVNAKVSSESLISALTVSSQSSVTEPAITASLAVDVGHISSLQTPADRLSPSHKNTRLNELWYRFSQDHTVCSPRATDSDAAVNITAETETNAVDSNMQPSRCRHPVQSFVRHNGENSQHFNVVEKQQQRSSSGMLVSNNLLGYGSSSAVGFISNVHPCHHNLSPDGDHVQPHDTEPLHSSVEVYGNMENRISGEPLMSDDAGKVSSLSVKHAWIVKDETLPVVPEDTTLGSVTSDFTSTSSIDNMGNIVTLTTKRHLPTDSKLLRLQQKIAQQREKHRKVRINEQRRKEHIVNMELALCERQKAVEQKSSNAKKAGDGCLPSDQLEMTLSSSTLMTVTGSDSDLNLCSSSLQSDDRHLTSSSRLLSAFETSGSCSCQQAPSGMQRVVSPNAKDVVLQKRHKSETTFKPKLREVKYTSSKVTKSAPSVLSHETSRREPDGRNALAKDVRKNVAVTSDSHKTHIPKTAATKDAQGDKRNTSKTKSPSKTSTSASKASLLKTSHATLILTKKHQQFNAELGMLSKAVQTTPRLKDNRVLYASRAVQCPAVSNHFDEMGVISLPMVSKDQHARSLSSKVFSPDSSSDAELLQHLKHKSLMKLPVKASVPRELLTFVYCIVMLRQLKASCTHFLSQAVVQTAGTVQTYCSIISDSMTIADTLHCTCTLIEFLPPLSVAAIVCSVVSLVVNFPLMTAHLQTRFNVEDGIIVDCPNSGFIRSTF